MSADRDPRQERQELAEFTRDATPAVATEGDVRALLRDLVHDIDAANAGDQLEGYLDYLAAEFNVRLERAGLPTIGVYGERT